MREHDLERPGDRGRRRRLRQHRHGHRPPGHDHGKQSTHHPAPPSAQLSAAVTYTIPDRTATIKARRPPGGATDAYRAKPAERRRPIRECGDGDGGTAPGSSECRVRSETGRYTSKGKKCVMTRVWKKSARDAFGTFIPPRRLQSIS
ncbi:hypothetical protein GCM10018962_68250 [Dactylosporangium matsuzakiense]|uniref:Uncharacterized protein n=1 Tax=Dactylosporangium matsuzakiense TaxID=53360 RepID=A0A9W6KQI6_9ACTN|nr:hypothetical protein GCM10017581_080500 [Dactylosporangium matsuzakiense]